MPTKKASVLCIAALTLALSSPYTFGQQSEPQSAKPNWVPTGKLNIAREYHTATLLPDGRVLVIGGRAYEDWAAKNNAEIYDPSTGLWRSTGSLNVARSGPTATLLPTGQVLVTGGSETRSAELYDPVTGRWRTTASLITARYGHTATLLPNGRVLIVGGTLGGDSRTGLPGYVRNAELYDPATERWSSAEAPSTLLLNHKAALLPDGKVLAIGNRECANIAEVYDPGTGRWSPTAFSPAFGCATTATLLANGRVLVIGRSSYFMLPPGGGDRTQLYDPATSEWSVTTAPREVGASHTLTLLTNGQVLATGGQVGDDSVNGSELYDPATEKWIVTAPLTSTRAGHSATLLATGNVLVAGGLDGLCCDAHQTLDTADLFDVGLPLPRPGKIVSVAAANLRLMGLAREGLAVSEGRNLATTSIKATTVPPPEQLAGTTVKVRDETGVERLAPLLSVSPYEVRYQVPPGTTAGVATITVTSGDGTVSSSEALIHTVAPGVFAANGYGGGVAAGVVRRLRADGSSSDEPIARFVPEHGPDEDDFVSIPIDLGPETDRVLLLLRASGIRFRSSLSAVIVTIGGTYAEVISAEAQPDSLGVDQVEVLVPRSLAGRGEIDVLLTVDAQMANPVRINIK